MLSEILTLFENHKAILCVDEIALELEEDPAIITGMLDHLVQMGRLNRIVDQESCTTCRVQHSCVLFDLDRPVYKLPS